MIVEGELGAWSTWDQSCGGMQRNVTARAERGLGDWAEACVGKSEEAGWHERSEARRRGGGTYSGSLRRRDELRDGVVSMGAVIVGVDALVRGWQLRVGMCKAEVTG